MSRYYDSQTGKGTVTYTYDAQGQLLKAAGDKTYTYTYDNVGNILSASDGTTVHEYTYGNTEWRDLLTKYDGVEITYDNAGNPTSYYNGTSWNFVWGKLGRLDRAYNNGVDVSLYYTEDGLRTAKVVGGNTTTVYVYNDGKLMHEFTGSNYMDFFYDADGRPFALKYNGTNYYYILNLQGDVIRLIDGNGITVAAYEYDPYGKIISATGSMAAINPLRYRGYYYDNETHLYYCLSRYYDPQTGRFISADSYASTGQGILGFNMFAYCGNNPVNRIDPTGKSFIDWIKSGWNDVKDFFVDAYNYLSNSNEETALNNLKDHGFTFYKGAPVFSADFLGTSGFSFGIIGLGSDNLYRSDFNDTLNHEYGHFIHLLTVGPVNYFITTAIPSVYFADLTGREIFPYNYYFDLPWERTADHLGGVEREYLQTTNFLASAFFFYTLLYSRLTPY